ncbi:hypothetical protein G4B88_014530 [Cannabis sativa]|uniref:Bifunctional inhibitor/plant lipid transfer protein/seed storage helical domain-containing protein n=1 Tax=Cannabis sativa TaxID=3483 RepID=A0A7J6I919_CANSA|nr:hypothetical protein G4B88_014530 [Cannabis sativa]
MASTTRQYSSALIISLILSMNLMASSTSSPDEQAIRPDHYSIPNTNNNNKQMIMNPMKVSCPRDALKLGVCANVLHGAVGTGIGLPADHCCSVLDGLVDLEAAVCLCTAIKANILGININIPISLSLLINTCGIDMPSDFQCVSA